MSDTAPRDAREQLLADLKAYRDRHPVTSRYWRRVHDVRDLLWRCWMHRDARHEQLARINHVNACAEAAYLDDDGLVQRVRSGAVL